MKRTFVLALTLISGSLMAQSIQGTWQLTNSKTCFQADMKESETEKELTPMMGGTSASTVAKLIIFKKDGYGQEGVFSVGRKKGAEMESFKYHLNGQELSFMDKKSGMITRRVIVDELTDTSLKIHDAMKDCETKEFAKVK
ncbi:MAG TPA: hypothetical protein VL728_06510 [Cyclobacteriaceae bacterium]|jgi:hypothetical protein|nr:hypothetical protein [Cyclobacteriaceae bacterium]